MNRLIIIGAGGHGKVIADNAAKNGYTNIQFVDDGVMSNICMGFPIVGAIKDIDAFDDGQTDFIIGIGNNEIRKQIAEKHCVNWISLIHPAAHIAMDTTIGEGTVIMAGAVVNTSAMIGEHCIINTNAVIEHDSVIEDYVHISPNAALGGTVRIGSRSHVGIGATVINNVEICQDCVIGAGAVVVRDIENSGTYIGVPTFMIK